MPKEPDRPDGSGRAWLVKRLVQETGITEVEASDVVMLIGAQWPSLAGSSAFEIEALKPAGGSARGQMPPYVLRLCDAIIEQVNNADRQSVSRGDVANDIQFVAILLEKFRQSGQLFSLGYAIAYHHRYLPRGWGESVMYSFKRSRAVSRRATRG